MSNNFWGNLYILARPKFLMYSFTLHLLGAIIAYKQRGDGIFYFSTFCWLQYTVWITHLMTHFYNEYFDYHVDILNKKAGKWTGGSKILVENKLDRNVAIIAGIVATISSIMGGIVVLYHIYTLGTYHMSMFIVHGISVLLVGIFYTVPPLKLSYRGFGEPCVSYVLTYCTPACGLISQGGFIDQKFIMIITPLFILNMIRMFVMNIPDKESDCLGGKNTSIVLIGEEKAIALHNLFVGIVYVYLLPSLDIPYSIKLGYYMCLPVRWWISLQLNIPNWWENSLLCDQIPLYESMFVLLSGTAITVSTIML